MNVPVKTEKSFLGVSQFENEELVNNCVKEIEGKLLEYPKIKIYGKECCQRRCIGFFSDESIGYKYSGQIAKSQTLSTFLKQLLEEINTIYDSDYNGILINKYCDGEDYISAHSDDEKNLSKSGVVAISVGAERIFRIRDKTSKKIIVDIPTIPYGIIQMAGDFQKEFTHEIPKQKRVKKERISFTFRKHLE